MTEILELDVLIVGAGFAGVYGVHHFREQGLSVKAIEGGSDVGGVWYHNRYPGARCDVRSLDYSYSFSNELQQEWRWTERFAAQPEIQRYIRHVAERFDLLRDIILETRVTKATFDAEAARWHVETSTGLKAVCRYLVLATGQLSERKELDFAGLESFRGEWHRTSAWPHDPVDFRGKRVGIFGTGSSGVQSIPEIAKTAEHLTVFQRTPVFAMPARNGPIDEAEYAEMRARYPEYRAEMRRDFAGLKTGRGSKPFAEFADEAERRARFESGWEWGSLEPVGTFSDNLVNPVANAHTVRYFHEKIREIVKDPETAEALCPKTFPVGARRPCLESGYYETFNRPNVTLIDLMTDPFVSITPDGIDTQNRHHALDMIVFATGFDALTGAALAIDITGRDGLTLREAWKDGPGTLLGYMSEGFPNMLMVSGPASPGIITNVVMSSELETSWIGECVAYLDANGYRTIEPTREAQDAWMAHTAELASKTLYPQADSWLMGANIPGKKRMFLAYLGGLGNFHRICRDRAAAGYEGFTLG